MQSTRRGRPGYDQQGILGVAVAAFNEYGYDATSIGMLAERLGLRMREELLGWIGDGGLTVVDRLETVPRHGRASDAKDALHEARRGEITSLWRLAAVTD